MNENNTQKSSAPALCELSGSALAYLGDAVLEVMVRRMLVETGVGNSGKLNDLSRDYVRDSRQSAGLERILPLLTEEEEAAYRRGRNAAGAHPKSATMAEYRRATGFEALFGYLYMKNDAARLDELFRAYVCAEAPGKEDSSDL